MSSSLFQLNTEKIVNRPSRVYGSILDIYAFLAIINYYFYKIFFGLFFNHARLLVTSQYCESVIRIIEDAVS